MNKTFLAFLGWEEFTLTQKNSEMGTVTAANINDRRERMREQKPGPSTPTRNVRFII